MQMSVLVVALVLASVAPAAAQLFSWTDDQGVTHYTADPWTVPVAFRPAGLPEFPPPRMPLEPWAAWGEPAPVRAPSGATVEFRPGDPIVVGATLNGVAVSLLLDTGADRTLLSPAAVRRAGYGELVVRGGDTIRILSVTGAAVAAVVTVPELDVAGARIGPLSLIVHDAGLGSVDGLLGRDVLDSFTVTIDSAAGRATLTPR
jgi:hypothetical protein